QTHTGPLTLTWNAQPDARYRVLYKSQLDEPVWNALPGDVISSGDRATKIDDGLGADRQRFYRIEFLSECPDFAAGTAPPPRPCGLTALSGDGRVILNWLPSAGATGYIVRRGTSSGSYTASFATTSPPFQDALVQNGTTYYYVVSALRNTNESSFSAEVSVTPLAPPTQLAATAAAGRVTLSWMPSTGATNYRVRRGASSGSYTATFEAANSPWDDQTVANGTTYFYVVAAEKGASLSANSSEVSAATPLLPPAALSASVTNHLVTLTWPPAEGAASYRVKRGTTSGVYTTTFATTASTYLDSSVRNGTRYFYAVSSLKCSIESSNSIEVASFTPLLPPT